VRVAFGRALLGPRLEKRDLLIRKPEIPGEFQFRGSGKPRGHDATAGDGGDLRGEFGGVLIIEQRKRRGFAGTVAR